MKIIEWVLSKLIKKDEEIICQRCKMHKPPEKGEISKAGLPTFVIVRGEIIVGSKSPRVFTCPEQAFNYAQGIIMHTECWIATLREHGTELYDMGKVYEEYEKRAKNGGK